MAIQRPLRDDIRDGSVQYGTNHWSGSDSTDTTTDAEELAASEPLVSKSHHHVGHCASPSHIESHRNPRDHITNKRTRQRSAPATLPSSWSSHARTAAQLGVVACIGAYTFGQVLYLSPLTQETLATAMSPWLGVAVSRTPAGILDFEGGHVEMLRPMFFVVWAVLPLLLSLVLYELARDTSGQRAASRLAMRTGALLRRKPSVYSHVSPFSIGELLFQVALVGGNIALFAYGWVYTRQFLPLSGVPYTFDTTLEISGIVLGYSCVFNMAFLLLPSTRNCAWMDFVGIAYTNGVKYHRWLGVATLVTGVLHAVPFYWWWARIGTLAQNALPCFDCAVDYLSPGYKTWFNVFGELSLLALLVVGATSIPYVRRRWFETFYYTHHLYILGVVFAVMHWVTIIWWLLPTLVLYLISRSVSTWNARRAVRVLAFTALPDDIVKIVVARADSADGAFALGQFVYVCVPVISRLQWHAFTIASAPTTSTTSFTILLKALGDWTRDLVVLAESSDTATSADALPTMLIDGYYGASLQGYEQFDSLCLIGGGIGATPLFAILEDMMTRLTAVEMTGPLPKRVHFVFSFRELCLLAEIHPVLTALRAIDPHNERLALHFFLTRQPSDAALQQRIDNVCRRSDRTDNATAPASTATTTLALPSFREPLHSRTARITVYVVMLLTSTLVVLWLEVGGGRLLQNGTQWWPLEQFVEIATLFVLPVLVFVALAIEQRWTQRNGRTSDSTDADAQTMLLGASRQSYCSLDCNSAASTETSTSPPWRFATSGATDVVTLGDLISEYSVTVGARPDMQAILTRIHREFVANRPDDDVDGAAAAAAAPFIERARVGVFLSGPEALKTATEHAVADLGASDFDIHAEEFEL